MMKANKQIGFIYKNNESIDKILKDGEVVFEKGFLREKTSTTLPITFGGVGKNLKDYKVYGNTVQNGTPTPDAPIEMVSCGDLITDSQDENYGKYKIPVNVRSDNLFDKAKVTNGYYIDSNGDLISHNSFAYSDYIQIKENTVYSYSGSTGLANYARKCAWYDSSKNLIRVDNFGNSGQLTSPNNAKYFRTTVRIIASGTQGADINTYQLVEGSTAPSKYIPYYNQTTNIYLDEPLRKIDGYSDYIDFINGKVVRNISEVVLNGSETWNKNTIPQNIKTERFSSRSPFKHIINIGYCDTFVVKSESMSVYSDTEMFQLSSSADNTFIGILINKDRLVSNTVENFINWLSSNPTIVDYVLLTPTEESITLPNIPTIDGNNTLNIETELTPSQVYIKYKSNT